MLYLIKYFSIIIIFLIIVTAFTSVNTIVESREAFEESKKFIKIRKMVLCVLLILVIVSSISIRLVKNTYYTESVLVSVNEIVSIEEHNSKIICNYETEDGKIKTIQLKKDNLGEFTDVENLKILKYEINTKSDMNPTLFKFLTFNHLPKENIEYRIEK